MKKKMFLRGLGLGILVTALVLTITGSSKMSDEEIIKRAEKLGYAKQESDVSPTISLKDLMGTGTPTPTQTPTVMPQRHHWKHRNLRKPSARPKHRCLH